MVAVEMLQTEVAAVIIRRLVDERSKEFGRRFVVAVDAVVLNAGPEVDVWVDGNVEVKVASKAAYRLVLSPANGIH